MKLAKALGRNGQYHPTRCGRCAVREACDKVCETRIRSVPEIRDAVLKFKGAGGAIALNDKYNKEEALRAFDRVERALVKHGDFSSINDQRVEEYYTNQREERKRKDAVRKRLERSKRLRAGFLDEKAHELIRRHKRHREIILLELLRSPPSKLPLALGNLPLSSVTITAEVWAAREVLRAQKQSVNPSSIARHIIDQSSPLISQSHNSFRQRIAKDLARVELLERFKPDGVNTVWPTFDLLKETEAEEALLPPYS